MEVEDLFYDFIDSLLMYAEEHTELATEAFDYNQSDQFWQKFYSSFENKFESYATELTLEYGLKMKKDINYPAPFKDVYDYDWNDFSDTIMGV